MIIWIWILYIWKITLTTWRANTFIQRIN